MRVLVVEDDAKIAAFITHRTESKRGLWLIRLPTEPRG